MQPSDDLKHKANMKAVGKLSEAADPASNLISAAEQPEGTQQKPTATVIGA